MRPTRRLYAALLVWALTGLLAAVWPGLLPVWALTGAAVAAGCALDGVRLRRLPLPTVERKAPASLALGAPNTVDLRLHNPGPRPLTVEVFDHHPVACATEGLPRTVDVAPGGWVELGYRLLPHRRGEAAFERAELLLSGPGLGLLRRRAFAGEPTTLRVYPNFREVIRYALLALADRLGQMGIRTHRRRGEGLEFEQLRDYRQGDLLRQVDWKATARRRRLISREYQDEKNQQVVFLVDCGRRMRARDGDLSHFDHVLNAILLLTYVGVRQGDAVGFMTFSGEQRWLPPQKGPKGMSLVLERSYDLETTTAPSDFAEAAQRLMVRQKRRALVILVTNLRDEDDTELQPALAALRTRHLVLLASLREAALVEAMEDEVRDFRSALRLAEAHRHDRERRRAHEAARQSGVVVLDVPPAELPVSLVNRYLDIKRSGML